MPACFWHMLYARLWPPSLLFFLCLFVAWARANYSIVGLPLNRSFDSLIVGLKMVSLWGPSGWRQDPCAILPQNVALLNQLRCCNCFHSECTPFLLKVGCGVHLSSVSSCLLFVSMFVCYSSAGLPLQFDNIRVLSWKQFFVFATLHP